MRSAVLLFCLGLTSGLWAKDRSTYVLKWKLPANDTLLYMTAME